MHFRNLLIIHFQKPIKTSIYGKINFNQFHVLLYRAEMGADIINVEEMYLVIMMECCYILEAYILMSTTLNQFQNLSKSLYSNHFRLGQKRMDQY